MRSSAVRFTSTSLKTDEQFRVREFADKIGATHIVASDGSVHQGELHATGGGACYYRRGIDSSWARREENVWMQSDKWGLGHGKSSYDTETETLTLGLEKAAEALHAEGCGLKPTVVTTLDGQSTISKMAGRVPASDDEARLCRAVDSLEGLCDLIIVHGKGHSGIDFSEEADKLADAGQKLQRRQGLGGKIGVSHKGVDSAIARSLRDARNKELRNLRSSSDSVEFYLRALEGCRSMKPDPSHGDTPRYLQSIVNQILCGRCPSISGQPDFRDFISGTSCPACGHIGKPGANHQSYRKTSYLEHAIFECPRFTRPAHWQALCRDVGVLCRPSDRKAILALAHECRILDRNQPPAKPTSSEEGL